MACHCNRKRLPDCLELTEEEIGQLWAEAVTYYKNERPLYLDEATEREALTNQRLAMELDPRQGIIGEYLENTGKEKICLMELWV